MKDTIVNTQSNPVFYINVNSRWYTGQLKILDLTWYEPYKETGDAIICAFVYLTFLWSFFTRLPDIIQGAGASSNVIGNVGLNNFSDNHSASLDGKWHGARRR